MREFEDAMLEFVKNRIPEDEWKTLTIPNHILRNIEDDDEFELKSRMWELLLQGMNWNSLFNQIRDMTEESESENESENESESENSESD